MKYLTTALLFSLLSMHDAANAGIPLNSENLEQAISKLRVDVEQQCAHKKTLSLCNQTLEQTQRAIQIISLSGANSKESQIQLSKLQALQQSAIQLKSRAK